MYFLKVNFDQLRIEDADTLALFIKAILFKNTDPIILRQIIASISADDHVYFPQELYGIDERLEETLLLNKYSI